MKDNDRRVYFDFSDGRMKERVNRRTPTQKLTEELAQLGWTLEGTSGDYEVWSNELALGVTMHFDTLKEVRDYYWKELETLKNNK